MGSLIPHEDEYQNEYLPAANDRLAWATGFTGSAGAAIILKDKAAVFVDGRYALQVRDQVDAGVFEIRDLVEGGPAAWLGEAAAPGSTIGYDPRLHSPDAPRPSARRRRQGGRDAESRRSQSAGRGLGRGAAGASRPPPSFPTRWNSRARVRPTSARASAPRSPKPRLTPP